jgi:predicted porin
MQKKIMAIAVAGVLGAPAVALAQTSTVQVFGTFNFEYGLIDQGASAVAGTDKTNADFMQAPGNEIGFKGEEKLGGGLAAWFQCASSADIRGNGQDGWCSRNSAVGLKGGFGNVFLGIWDAPFKRAISPTTVGGNDTGFFGTATMLLGGSTTTGLPNSAGAAGTGAPAAARAVFKRRQTNSINYDSPTWGGFRFMAMMTAAQSSTSSIDTAANEKPRVYSFAGQYSAGPLFVSAGYELHNEFNGGTTGGVANREGDEKGWFIGAAYTWGPVRFGGQFTKQKIEMGTAAAPTESRVAAWHVGVDWRIVGPHGLRAAVTTARDVKGNGPAIAVRPAAGPDTGTRQYQIRYVYTFSKRTEFAVGVTKVDNESAATYSIQGVGAAVAGENQRAIATTWRHTF